MENEQKQEHVSKEQPRKLFRSCKNRVIAGVCEGLGKYFDIDPVLVRVIFVLLALAHGLGILLYLVLALLIPCENHVSTETELPKNERWLAGRNVIGIILIAIGSLLLLNLRFPGMWWWFSWSYFWPILMVLLGWWLVLYPRKK